LHAERLGFLLAELGRRKMTNVLIEGGGQLMGTFLDSRQIDEVHVFIAPKLIGGEGARSPIDGEGINDMSAALDLEHHEFRQLDNDFYLSGRIKR
jgi:diaminohydroxyphosphoribosylaminopyrimidine deaminase/5-amino-6-(5-phosphoribosylamino)uracil reductase